VQRFGHELLGAGVGLGKWATAHCGRAVPSFRGSHQPRSLQRFGRPRPELEWGSTVDAVSSSSRSTRGRRAVGGPRPSAAGTQGLDARRRRRPGCPL